MCAMRYECGGGGGVMRHGLRRAVLWPGVCGAVRWSTRCLLLCGEQSGGERECLCRYLRIRVVAIGTMRRELLCVLKTSASVQAYLTRAHTAQSYFLYAATHESFL